MLNSTHAPRPYVTRLLAIAGLLTSLGLAGCWDLSTRSRALPPVASREADVPTPRFFQVEGTLAPSEYGTTH